MNKPLAIQSSESIAELSKALIEFHRRVPKIPKSCRNPFLKSRYADLSTILDIVQPVLNECELVIQQHPTSDFGLTTILSHSSGEWMSSEYRMMPPESVIEKAKDGAPAVKGITPQSIGSVITYQRRYAIGAILSLNIDDDTDGHIPGSGNGGGSSSDDKPAAPPKTAMELMQEAAARVEEKKKEGGNANGNGEAKPSTQAAAPATANSQPGMDVDGDSTQAQRDRIQELYRILNIGPEAQASILAKRGLSVLRSLSAEQAAVIIQGLEKKLPLPEQFPSGMNQSTTLADQPPGKPATNTTAVNTSGPCTDDQVTAIKTALEEWEQTQPGVSEAFINALRAAGFAKIKDMTFDQARRELQAIQMKQAENFFGGVGAVKQEPDTSPD